MPFAFSPLFWAFLFFFGGFFAFMTTALEAELARLEALRLEEEVRI